MKKGPDLLQSSPLVGIPPFSAYEKTALCLIRAVISVGWQSIFGCFIVYPFVHRRKGVMIVNTETTYTDLGGEDYSQNELDKMAKQKLEQIAKECQYDKNT